jgi:stage III sporulation protein AE
MVSDAADAVASGVVILKNAVGVFGMLTVVALCAVPIVRLGVNSLMFRAAAALSETIADSKISDFIGSISTAYGMILALAGTSAIMLFVSIVSVMRAVTGT